MVLKKEFFRVIAVDLGGSGKELMKEIRKPKKIEDKVKEKVERRRHQDTHTNCQEGQQNRVESHHK